MGRYQRDLLDAVAGVYRYDKLLVLKYTNMPAVLFEAGNIVNREDEIVLQSNERRATIASAVTHAVDGFCVARGTSKPDLIARKLPNLEKVAHKATRHAGKSSARYASKKTARSATLDASTLKRR